MTKNIDIGIIIVDFPRPDLCDPAAWNCVVEAAIVTKKAIRKPVALLSTLAENIEESLKNNYQYSNPSYSTSLRTKIYASMEYIVDHNNFVSLSKDEER